MTTSGVTAWSKTARDIVEAALCFELGISQDIGDVSSGELNQALHQLNSLLRKLSQASYLLTTATVTIPADDASGILPVGINSVISARLSETNERILARFERDEYYSLPNKAASGAPTCFYADRQRDATTLFVWPVPSVNTDIRVDYYRAIETVTNASETVDIPEEWQAMVIANLAVMCAGRYRISPNEVPELFARADQLMRTFEDDQRPASYYMGAW